MLLCRGCHFSFTKAQMEGNHQSAHGINGFGDKEGKMRDIRDDLEERAKICQEQIKTVCAQFEVRVQQLQRERDARVSDLKGARAMLERLMQFENNLTGNVLAQEPSLAERIKAVNAN
jgi:hypothetical protein